MISYLDFYLETVNENPDLPTLRELEKDYIGFLLEVTRHNVTQVSRILAISRTAVYHKISRYSISKPNCRIASLPPPNISLSRRLSPAPPTLFSDSRVPGPSYRSGSRTRA
jgi:hypothetical protein